MPDSLPLPRMHRHHQGAANPTKSASTPNWRLFVISLPGKAHALFVWSFTRVTACGKRKLTREPMAENVSNLVPFVPFTICAPIDHNFARQLEVQSTMKHRLINLSRVFLIVHVNEFVHRQQVSLQMPCPEVKLPNIIVHRYSL